MCYSSFQSRAFVSTDYTLTQPRMILRSTPNVLLEACNHSCVKEHTLQVWSETIWLIQTYNPQLPDLYLLLCIKGFPLPQNRAAVARWPLAQISTNTPAEVVNDHCTTKSHTKCHQLTLSNTQLLSAIDELYCPICLSVLRQPIQLPCDRLVCTLCLVEWIHLRGSCCPCCYSPTPLECTQINPASRIILLLLNNVMVLCAACKRSVKAVKYDTHCCTEEVH